ALAASEIQNRWGLDAFDISALRGDVNAHRTRVSSRDTLAYLRQNAGSRGWQAPSIDVAEAGAHVARRSAVALAIGARFVSEERVRVVRLLVRLEDLPDDVLLARRCPETRVAVDRHGADAGWRAERHLLAVQCHFHEIGEDRRRDLAAGRRL